MVIVNFVNKHKLYMCSPVLQLWLTSWELWLRVKSLPHPAKDKKNVALSFNKMSSSQLFQPALGIRRETKATATYFTKRKTKTPASIDKSCKAVGPDGTSLQMLKKLRPALLLRT